MQRWEYAFVFEDFSTKDWEKPYRNETMTFREYVKYLGEIGYELVAVTEGNVGRTLYFKRPIETYRRITKDGFPEITADDAHPEITRYEVLDEGIADIPKLSEEEKLEFDSLDAQIDEANKGKDFVSYVNLVNKKTRMLEDKGFPKLLIVDCQQLVGQKL